MENKDEIILNINRPNKSNKKKKKPIKKNKNKNNKIKNINEIKKKRKKARTIKAAIIIISFVAICILLASSEIFNIKKISVEGVDKLTDKEIISYSNIIIGENTFKTNLNKSEKLIKENPYVKSVEVKRKFPSTIVITIEERKEKYAVQLAESYLYVDSQGYILEISKENKNIPILLGIITDLSNIKPNDRLDKEDLLKFDMVNKIVENCKSYEIDNLITKVDITNTSSFILYLETESKKVYLGDASNLNTRMLWLKSIIQQTKDKKGTIYLDMDLNSKKPYFRAET